MDLLYGFILAFVFITNTVESVDYSSGEATEPTFTIINQYNNIGINTKPYIDGDHILNATLGKRITMKCIVHNVKTYKIVWYFNGILLTLNTNRIRDDKRYSIENPTPHEWKLIIDPVSSSDEGQYSCRLTNGLKRSIFLTVGVPPTFIGNNASHQIVINAIEKENVTLSCEAEGNPTPMIYWYRHNKLVGTGPHFTLKDISRHTHSEYECVARNTIEPDSSRHFKLNVNFKATVNLMYHLREHGKPSHSKTKLLNLPNGSDEHAVNEGDLQFVCEINGNPINSISWYKDGIKLQDDNKLRLAYRDLTSSKRKKSVSIHTTHANPHKYVSKLKIRNFDHLDNGAYKCAVSGFEGEVSKSVYINEISLKSQEIDKEYTFNSNNSKNLIKYNQDEKHRNNDKNIDENLIESSFLMQGSGSGRGARSNLTKSDDFNNLNNNSISSTKICRYYYTVAILYMIFSTCAVFGLF